MGTQYKLLLAIIRILEKYGLDSLRVKEFFIDGYQLLLYLPRDRSTRSFPLDHLA